MRPFLLSTLTASAMALGACYINVDKHGDAGMLGDDCVVDEDCHAGLVCGPEDECIADPDDPAQGAGGTGASGTGAGGTGAGGTGAGTSGEGGDVGGGSAGGCQSDADCEAGEICRTDGSCEVPLCSELNDEAGCVERSDCEAVYAGIDCSCGPDCTCTAGEAGCVCESFEFFKCQDVSN